MDHGLWSVVHGPMPMHLRSLLQELPELPPRCPTDIEIGSLASDSRQVSPGALFVAVRGRTVDGHRFLREAVAKGAAAAVGESLDPGLGIPYFQVSDSRLALARLAAAWYGHPARRMVMIGVTGTDGKTTTANLIQHILLAAGIRPGMITTVNAVIGDRVLDTGLHVTTPEAPALQGYLADMVKAGLTHCVLEATSHGLAQHRVAACEFDIGVVTNVTREHLDYHGSFQAYLEAKGLLFAGLEGSAPKANGPARLAVLNRDDASYVYLSQVTSVRQVAYGLGEGAEIKAEEIRASQDGLSFVASGPGFRRPINTRLIGAYNVQNCLAALAATVIGLGIAPATAAEGIAALQAVPGRMERIDLGQPFIVLVDFAHTPNALRRALEAARPMAAGRLIAVFGSAGLRDREKRRKMAETSVELADLTVLTAEDPRTEPLEAILEEMAAGARSQGGSEGVTFRRTPDRGEAIRFAIRLAGPGDVVIVCGKGHEQSMCFGDVEYPWDDRTAVRAALAERLGLPGPGMPRLPTS
jgi:UDP-N-acetylmuramoyl-L-alanyl-D-glutamate--2,6-diaminopimelate ligase